MWKIIILAILLLIALAIFLWRPKSIVVTDRYAVPQKTKTQHWWPIGFIPLGLALLLLLFTSFTQVHAKEIGVGVSFGRPVSEYDAGLHFKPFWQSVTKINETVYTDTYGGNTKDAMKAVPVRLGDGNPATVDTTIRWHVNPDAVDYIYATYRSDDPADQLRTAVVDTQYQAVVNNVFGSFNPTSVIQDVNLKDPLQASRALNFSPDYTQMAKDINDQMLASVKDAEGTPLVVIDKVTVAGINYSDATEKRIEGLVQQAAKTQQAVQLEATNIALADANSKLSNSLSGEDGVKVLVQQCLQDLADGKFDAPAGFSCWPGAGSSVVIPATK
ncbi:MAG: hypothetical protein HOV97_05585 [Nonomuraea sp.]|nr:hypothetical protein [Nonomuraea sp.]